MELVEAAGLGLVLNARHTVIPVEARYGDSVFFIIDDDGIYHNYIVDTHGSTNIVHVDMRQAFLFICIVAQWDIYRGCCGSGEDNPHSL